ncbi:MAG: hypothetical protein J1G06_04625 [Oscillospiraceae bacterium]|nr:hypothetical protein [Oscillospiraceae bacterium]
MKNGYKIDFEKNTITVNYKFAAAMKEYGSPEYIVYRQIMHDFPQLELVIKSGRQQKTPRYNKNVKYENMEKYISTFDNSEELMERFNIVKSKSVIFASPYKYVCDWFKAQFPDYKEIPNFDNKGIILKIEPAPKAEDYKQKEEEPAA